MPNFLHRTTKEYLPSKPYVELPEPLANYIEDPDLSAVTGFDSKYWTITGDIVSLMTPAERAQVDADELTALIAGQRAEEVVVVDATRQEGMRVRALIELFNKRDNYLVNRIIELQQALDAVKATTGPADNIRAAIPASWLATNTRAKPAAVQEYKDDINAGLSDGP